MIDGLSDGLKVGLPDGSLKGLELDSIDGSSDGMLDGLELGSLDITVDGW